MWLLIFDSYALTYRDIMEMDLATFTECQAAKAMYVDLLRREQEEARNKAGG